MFVVIRSVLESADQALRHKPRQPSIVSSVVRSPPPKSSVQKMGSESGQSVTTHTAVDVRTVVHTKSKDSSKHARRHRRSSSKGKHSSSSHQRSVADRNPTHSSEQLLITVTEDDRNAMANVDEPKHYQSAVDERKVSILDEDQFEPDYDEGEMAAETHEDVKHSRHKHSRHASSHSDSASKSKKHKKRKKSKRHKSKSKKSEK